MHHPLGSLLIGFLLCAAPCLAQTFRAVTTPDRGVEFEVKGAAGRYRVEVSSDLRVWTEHATLILGAPDWEKFAATAFDAPQRFFRLVYLSKLLQILSHPVSVSVEEGSVLSLSVTATGDAPLTFQWFRNGTSIAGATGALYRVANVGITAAGLYTVTVTSPGASITTQPASVTVIPKRPSISTQPSNISVQEGQSFTLRVVAAGTPPLTYQWFRNGSVIGGASTNVYTVTNATVVSAGVYTVRITSGSGGVSTSQAAVVTVSTKPVAPASLAGLTIRVSSSDAGPYRWISSPSGGNYVLFPDSGENGSRGSYTYSKTGTETGTITLNDYWQGQIVGNLAFTSASSGTISIGIYSGPFTIENITPSVSSLAPANIATRTIRAAIVDGDGALLSDRGGWIAVIHSSGARYTMTSLGFDGSSAGALTYRRLNNTSSTVTLADSLTGVLNGSVSWYSPVYGEVTLTRNGGGNQIAVFQLQ